MKTRSAKAKGRRLQNLLVEKLRALYPHLHAADVRPALMGESGIDVKLSEAARRVIPYAFESKNVEKINIWDAIKQAEANATKEQLIPAVMFGRNRMPEPYVAVSLSHFLELMTRNGCREHLVKAGVIPEDLTGLERIHEAGCDGRNHPGSCRRDKPMYTEEELSRFDTITDRFNKVN